jgi:hypothetical protein
MKMEEKKSKIKEIHSKKVRKFFLLVFPLNIISTFGIIYFFYIHLSATENLFFQFLSLIVIIIILFIFISITSHIQTEPIIVYKNGITPLETKLKILLYRKREFIHFNKIKIIKGLGKMEGVYRFSLILNNNKKLVQAVDSLEDLIFIQSAYKDYNNKKRKVLRVPKS